MISNDDSYFPRSRSIESERFRHQHLSTKLRLMNTLTECEFEWRVINVQQEMRI